MNISNSKEKEVARQYAKENWKFNEEGSFENSLREAVLYGIEWHSKQPPQPVTEGEIGKVYEVLSMDDNGNEVLKETSWDELGVPDPNGKVKWTEHADKAYPEIAALYARIRSLEKELQSKEPKQPEGEVTLNEYVALQQKHLELIGKYRTLQSLKPSPTGPRWVKASERLPEAGRVVLFDFDENPPMWGRIEIFPGGTFLVTMDSSGEEESDHLETGSRWLDESAPSPTVTDDNSKV